MDFKFVTFLDEDDMAAIKAPNDFDARVAGEATIGRMVNRLKAGNNNHREQEVSTITIKFEADTSALHGALDDVLDHVDEVNSALCGYLDEPAIGDVVMLVSGGELMTVEGFCECGSVDVVWFSGNDSEGWIINRDTFDVGMLVCVDDE